MKEMKRFTLRREYFGGVLHDAKKINCYLLTSFEFGLLADMANGKRFSIDRLAEDSFSKKVLCLIAKTQGAVVVNETGELILTGTRYISPPAHLPENCLTAPIRVYHSITRKCNLRCAQCCLSSTADFDEIRLSIRQLEEVMRKFYKAGTMEWRFTGGEPTSCPDILEAIVLAKNFGMAVMLNTNGCWPEKMIDGLLQSGVDVIIISLEGRAEVNDKRRSPGVFNRIIRSLGLIARHNRLNPESKIGVTLNMTVARDNVSEVEFVVRLGATYGYNVNFVPLRPYGRTLTDLRGTMLSTEEFMKFSESVQRLRNDPQILQSGIRVIHRNMDLFCPDYPDKQGEPYPFNYSECGALSTGFGLCPNGQVNACSFLMNDPEFLGPNMLDVSSAGEAWLHPNMEHFRRAKKLGCVGCRFYQRQCEGKCRAMVLANKGRIQNNKLIGKDPYCFAHLMPR